MATLYHERWLIGMPDMITVSTKGQITLPADLRAEYGIEAGDKIFGERTEEGYILKRPKKTCWITKDSSKAYLMMRKPN